jgi:Ca2+-binding EF-hand superfamily protein
MVIFDLSNVPKEDVSDVVKECFENLDTQGRGFLELDSFKAGCANLGRQLTNEECAKWIADADVDGNGVVDLEEFEHLARQAFDISCLPRCNVCCINALAKSYADVC